MKATTTGRLFDYSKKLNAETQRSRGAEVFEKWYAQSRSFML
jgi:hypothetical protein